MYCKHCGEQIDDNSKFCKHCGKNLDSGSAGISSLNTLSNNFKFNSVLFSSIVFIITIILCFSNWITINVPSLINGGHTYSASLITLIDLLQSITKVIRYFNDDMYGALALITSISLVFFGVEMYYLIVFFIGVIFNKNHITYFVGKIFSLFSVIFSILFIVMISLISNEFSEATYDVIDISVGVFPFLIAIINTLAFVWLFIERRNLLKEEIAEISETL